MNLRNLKKYSFSSDLITRKIDEETTMIYNPENGDMYELNSVSAEIIKLLQENKTGDQIIDYLANEYNVEIDLIIEDTKPLIGRLIEMNLLKIEG